MGMAQVHLLSVIVLYLNVQMKEPPWFPMKHPHTLNKNVLYASTHALTMLITA